LTRKRLPAVDADLAIDRIDLDGAAPSFLLLRRDDRAAEAGERIEDDPRIRVSN